MADAIMIATVIIMIAVTTVIVMMTGIAVMIVAANGNIGKTGIDHFH